MTHTSKIFASIGLAFLVVAAVMRLVAFREVHKYRQTVLEAPMRFEKGTSLERPFTVDLPSSYWIFIGPINYPTGYKFSLSQPMPEDQFVAHYQITSGGTIVADGDNRSDKYHAGGSQRDHFSRYVAQFSAEPHRTYKLTLQFEDVAQEITSAVTTVAVVLDPHVREGSNYLAALLRVGAIPVGIIGLVVAAPFWYSLACHALQRTQPPNPSLQPTAGRSDV